MRIASLRAAALFLPFCLALPLSAGCAAPSASLPVASAKTADASAVPSDATPLPELARAAVSEDRDVAAKAISQLRARGPVGLDALFQEHAKIIERLSLPTGPATDAEALRVREALEKVARQRDAHASKLYWYTDLAEAERAARKTHRPILSLRLLGNLDEELSCANSRFFRTALYPNAQIGELLRKSFVLHWKSERPAPRVTIDFGDGRKLERTVTGNSIHYILDTEGRVVDALPGMYGPAAFYRGLLDAGRAFQDIADLPDEARRETLRAYHAARRDALANAWALLIGVPFTPPPAPRTSDKAYPPASEAIPTAVPKGIVEAPLVQAIQGTTVIPLPSPAQTIAWNNLLITHLEDSRLDAASRAFMRSKIAADVDMEGRAMGPLSDAAFERKVGAFERAITEDTVRNEHGMHRVLHEWLAMTPPPEEIEAFNERIYASLFLTPRGDPWLGLLAPDAYSGIAREGVEFARAAKR